MKLALIILMLSGICLAGGYDPSQKSLDEKDKPQLEQEQVLMPEQKGIQKEESGVDTKNEENLIFGEKKDTIRHGKIKGRQGKLVPYGIK